MEKKNGNVKRKINKKKLLALLIILMVIIGIIIFINIKKTNNVENDESNIIKIDLSQVFDFDDINSLYDNIINKYGMGTDNYNDNNKVYATVYNNKIMDFNCTNIFYYDDDMKVKYIEYIINDKSIYEVMNKMKEFLGDPFEYNDESEELSTEFKWKYDNYLIILKYNLSNANIIIKSNV